jgi:hypothetical protein
MGRSIHQNGGRYLVYRRTSQPKRHDKHKVELLGIADWEFNKPAEMVFRQTPAIQSQPAEDPLVQLKMKFVKGELSEEEYKAKLRVLQEK